MKAWLLATLDTTVRWYVFDPEAAERPLPFELVDELDLARVPAFESKDAAKLVAQAMGLKTWRYVRL